MNRGGSTTFSVSDSNIKSGVAKGVGSTINDPASERVREREGGGEGERAAASDLFRSWFGARLASRAPNLASKKRTPQNCVFP
jgi:hypothetical protein